MTVSRPLAAVLLSATSASCAQTAAPPTPPTQMPASAVEPESARLSRELRALVGPAACTADSQCRSLPVGARPCGGPAGYVAWSIQGTDADRLADLAARVAAAQRRENAASGLRSHCAFSSDPGAACVAGHCQLVVPAGSR